MLRDYRPRLIFPCALKGRDKMDGWKDLEGKKVFIELKNGRRYTANVIKYDNHFFKIVDKFGSTIFISIDEINLIEEQK